MSSDQNIGTLHLIARHLALSVVPLRMAISDLGSFRSFMYRLGWNVTSIPQSYMALGNLIENVGNNLESLPDSPSLSDIQSLFDEIKNLHTVIKNT
jgi:hypothetical protein